MTTFSNRRANRQAARKLSGCNAGVAQWQSSSFPSGKRTRENSDLAANLSAIRGGQFNGLLAGCKL